MKIMVISDDVYYQYGVSCLFNGAFCINPVDFTDTFPLNTLNDFEAIIVNIKSYSLLFRVISLIKRFASGKIFIEYSGRAFDRMVLNAGGIYILSGKMTMKNYSAQVRKCMSGHARIISLPVTEVTDFEWLLFYMFYAGRSARNIAEMVSIPEKKISLYKRIVLQKLRVVAMNAAAEARLVCLICLLQSR
ncbi:TPA: hypothetical protein SLP51_005214 [Klebsiella aerogenes]|nr:hypothetical protein [Klebsiella aerogenes]